MATTQVSDLVLEGGGVKGIGLVGAIEVLEENGWTFNRVAGASAGAIVGSLVAAGYTGAELHEIMKELDYSQFRDPGPVDKHLGVFGDALSLIFEQGIFKGRYLKDFLGTKLAAKDKTTFGSLLLPDQDSSLPPDQQYKLVVTVSDITHGRLCRLPWDFGHYRIEGDVGAQLVVDAVRASMSIPFFYEPVHVAGIDGKPCWWVDGGMLSNFPIDTFDRTDDVKPRWPTIGIKLSSQPTVEDGWDAPIHGTIGMAKALIATMCGFHDKMHLEDPAAVDRTIFVDTTGVQATDFDLSSKTADDLYEHGRDAAEKFLKAWDWEIWLKKYWVPKHPGG